MARTDHPIAGQVVAITGGGRGIGKATARALLQRGARVAIGDVDLAVAEQAAAELGQGCVALYVDVTRRGSVDAFLDGVEAGLGPIDVLVNNAGIMPTVRFLDETDASIERQFAVNVHGVMHGMRSVLPRMLARGSGHVINVASTAGKAGLPGVVTYCGTKHAVVGLTTSIRAELHDTPVAFSVVMPAIVRTELAHGVPDTRGIKVLQPEDVADAIVEAIQTRRFEVWVPRSVNTMYRASMLIPLRALDVMNRVVKTDRALLEAADNPDRRAYLDRIDRPAELAAPAEKAEA
jgi:NADP-dependent 3-hydroxy acid dehydrogenase YdfG